MLYDVGKIDAFYNGARGQMVAKLLREDLSNIWDPSKTASNLAVGFPFYFFPEGMICPVLMPAEIGGMAWAYEQEIYTAIIDSKSWPLESDSIDCILITSSKWYAFFLYRQTLVFCLCLLDALICCK